MKHVPRIEQPNVLYIGMFVTLTLYRDLLYILIHLKYLFIDCFLRTKLRLGEKQKKEIQNYRRPSFFVYLLKS